MIVSIWKYSHTKRKDNLEKQAIVLIILHELEISGVAGQETHQTACSENFYCGDDLEAVLFIFHSYNYGHTLLS